MKFTDPTVEWWQQETIAQHIARVGRICYKSEGKQPDPELSEEEAKAFIQKRDEERSKGFWDSGHCSMYRHGTCYFFVPNEKMLHTVYAWSLMVASPYISYEVKGNKVWISTNMQFLCEQGQLMQMLSPYGVSEEEYIKKAMKCKCNEALWLLRMTFVVTTQHIARAEPHIAQCHCRTEHTLLQPGEERWRAGVRTKMVCSRHTLAKVPLQDGLLHRLVVIQPTAEVWLETAGRTRHPSARHLYRGGLHIQYQGMEEHH